MEAHVLVLQNPFYSVVDDQGNYSIDKVPPGTYTLVAWSEKLPARETAITIPAGGRATVNLTLTR